MDVRFVATTRNRLPSLPISNGQLIYLWDENAAYYDGENQRRQVGQVRVMTELPETGHADLLYVIDRGEVTASLFVWNEDLHSFTPVSMDASSIPYDNEGTTIQAHTVQDAITEISRLSSYESLTTAQLIAGTDETQKLVRADYLKDGIMAFSGRFGECNTPGPRTTKLVTITGGSFYLRPGLTVGVKFNVTNTYLPTEEEPVRLNINSTGSLPIKATGIVPGVNFAFYGVAGDVNYYMYDGSGWAWLGTSRLPEVPWIDF